MKALFLLSLLLTGCLTNPQQMPILTCVGECTYYGPPQRNPNVEMAEVLTGSAAKLGLGLINGSVMKAAFDNNNNSTIERTTTTSDRSTASDTSATFVSDTSVSDTSVSDTSVSDTTLISDTSSVTLTGE